MKMSAQFDLPPDRAELMRRAIRLEWLSVGYLLTTAALMFVVMGASQAMRTAWIEDLLSLIPPLGFLIAAAVRRRPPNQRFPYGYYRAINIAFLFSAAALCATGVFLLVEALTKLAQAEHPTIGTVRLFGQTVWLAWLMLPVLVWSTAPLVILGHVKLRLARELHDKPLFADAQMNKADWMTGLAAMVGVLGIAWGWWWADSLAAALISLDILKDGVQNLRAVIGDLMDREPETVDRQGPSPVTRRLQEALEQLDWVTSAEVRLREHGHVYFGEVDLSIRDEAHPKQRLDEAADVIKRVSWRLHDVAIQIVRVDARETA